MSDGKQAIDDYLESLPDKRQGAVGKLRALITETLPQAREQITYNMPAVAVVDDEIVCSYKSQKNYISLYMDSELVEKHKEGLSNLNCGKSCIRFRHFEQLPQETIKAILRETVVKQANLANQK
jgi:uncharacterized protein YdhG (YjbR/CyaY superfamily)